MHQRTLFRRGSRALLLGLTLALLAALAVWVASALQRRDGAGEPDAPAAADVGIRGFSFSQTHAGALEWRITAERAELFEARNHARLEGVQVAWNTEHGFTLEFHGERGTIDTEKRDFHVENSSAAIAIRLSNGYTLYARSIDWNNERRELRSDEPVRITAPGLSIQGDGFVGRLADQEFRLSEGAHVTVD